MSWTAGKVCARVDVAVLAILRDFAKMLGLRHEDAEDALHSERAAQAVLSRRQFFAAAGAMSAGIAFSEGGLAAPVEFLRLERPIVVPPRQDIKVIQFAFDGLFARDVQ